MAQDFNPDKERHVDHTFVVMNAYPTAAEGLQTSKGFLKYDDQNRFTTRNEALAREIQQQHGNDVIVTRMRTSDAADRGHRYHFGQMPAMPWHKYDESGRRIIEGSESKEGDDGKDIP